MGRLIKYAKPYFWQSILCPFLMVGEVVMELLIPLYMGKIVDVGIQNGDMHYVLVTGGKMILMAARGGGEHGPRRAGARSDVPQSANLFVFQH